MYMTAERLVNAKYHSFWNFFQRTRIGVNICINIFIFLHITDNTAVTFQTGYKENKKRKLKLERSLLMTRVKNPSYSWF